MPTRVPETREDHDHWRELVAANAIGALDPADRAVLALHRARCASCTSLDRDSRLIAVRLLDAPGPIAPPPALRARVLAAVGAARPSSGPLWRRREFLVGLSLAAGIAIVVWIGLTSRAPGLARVVLAGVGPAAAARGIATIDRARGRVEIVVRDLPPLDSSQSYELWWIDAGSPHAAGVFRPDASGRARHRFAAEQALPGSAVLAVTIEGREVAAAPSGPIVLAER